MTEGFVYILTNTAMPGIVKVGKTTVDPTHRANQLSSATGVPLQFAVFRQYQVSDCDAAERLAHQVLERAFGRTNSQREFFSSSAEDAANYLDKALAEFQIHGNPSPHGNNLTDAVHRLERKEFTLAKQEFERIFKKLSITEEKILIDNSLQRPAGAYLASCFALDEAPLFRCILGTRVKGKIMEFAVLFAGNFESDPALPLINFVRRIE